MMNLARLLSLAAALAVCAARAEDAKPAAPPTQAATPARPAAPKAAPPPTAVRAAGTAAAPVMSESKFLGALYAAIAKRTPPESSTEGEVTASFHVNAQGKIDRVTIDKTTSPALAETVKKILSGVEAPPPPGGSMDVGQTFKFRGTPK